MQLTPYCIPALKQAVELAEAILNDDPDTMAHRADVKIDFGGLMLAIDFSIEPNPEWDGYDPATECDVVSCIDVTLKYSAVVGVHRGSTHFHFHTIQELKEWHAELLKTTPVVDPKPKGIKKPVKKVVAVVKRATKLH